jgi:2-hydroxy-3-oxopropionate reductase
MGNWHESRLCRLGHHGRAHAGHLQKGGHALSLFDLMAELPGDLFTGGAMARDGGRAVAEALMGGVATSTILENHGARMLEGNFEPGFRTELRQKDLNVALSAARDLGVVLPLAATEEGLYNALTARGRAKADHSASSLFWKNWRPAGWRQKTEKTGNRHERSSET